jgi:hypothetical protein
LTFEKSVAPPSFGRILEEAATTFDSNESGRWNPFSYVIGKAFKGRFCSECYLAA